ncbi:MAG: putative zinc-binding metallopeptidase [Burkholderiaceae bacterium]
MRIFECGRCGATAFFDNVSCVACGAALGFVPAESQMVAFDDAPDGDAWPRAVDPSQALRPCANRLSHNACNWMLDQDDAAALCRCCRLSLVIPDLGQAGHRERWLAVEAAKRRLVYGAGQLGLRLSPKTGEQDTQGLAFRILAPEGASAPVQTGHAQGLITLNLDEADDVQREATRAAFNEPWRTLLGHLRHELGHYLFHRWIAPAPALLKAWRQAFGDERTDYAAALSAYHEGGPPADWARCHVSAYASAHPHEDWAETAAHVLLIADGLETATSWGLRLRSQAAEAAPLWSPDQLEHFDSLVIAQWLPVAQFLNAMDRSLGLRDGYPFLLPPAVVDKLAAAAQLLHAAAAASVAPMPAAAAAAPA